MADECTLASNEPISVPAIVRRSTFETAFGTCETTHEYF
jgi:hypothetical protein